MFEVKETTVTRPEEKAYDIEGVITLSAGDTLKLESDGAEHIIMPVPEGETHTAVISVHICVTSA